MSPVDLKDIRAQTEAAHRELTPEDIKEHEKNLLRGVFDAWPEIVAGLCETTNELFKEQVVIAQALDVAPLKVKAVRPDTLRAAVDDKGIEGVLEVLSRVEANNREILRRAKALRAERDRLAAAQADGGSARGAPE
ncbi:MAG: hypothetical protein WDA16_05875 [Candidatus Thermoplasmatota archaeon]